SVNRTASVARVVMTSSVVAMFGDTREATVLPDGIVTESMWNESSNLTHQPYAYSKTVAEKEAWRIAGEQSRWDLVTIHPGLVIGPARTRRSDSTSIRIMIQMGSGTFRRGVPALWLGIVDVRDAAQAHINACLNPSAKGRYIVAARSVRLLDLAHHLLDRFGESYPFPRTQVPKWLVWLMAPGVGMTRKYVRFNVGFPIAFDNTRSRLELNLQYRPVQDSVIEHFQQLLDDGLIDPSRS
ncbi:MAG TPA: NAD-dependent epimerase/dehydratase family protein, partial [bacterium]|nr:NAD-dependent epimerase/dehydratase family protein [bacterium]